MVGVIILYDHVHPIGAFAKTATIEVCTTNHMNQLASSTSFKQFQGFQNNHHHCDSNNEDF